MPLRDYECEKCQEVRKDILEMAGDPPPECQICGNLMTRLLSTHGFYSIKGNNSASITPKKFRGES